MHGFTLEQILNLLLAHYGGYSGLAGQIKFTDIARINAQVLESYSGFRVAALDDILALDKAARAKAQLALRKLA